MKYGLSDSTLQDIKSVLSHYPQVELAVLYGSRAKGNYQTGSDIDLTLIGKSLPLNLVFRVLEDFDELFLPYTFDLSILNDIEDPDVLEHIHRVGITIYTKGEEVQEVVNPG